ncbi:NADPH2:quinone reductase [Nakamurella panacisegetis]|uniref:NADPH2:quinone reductase n=1 Tax=Nakamurella panacisegetis TaxID=1090615 RepID=A0A1H0QIG2_9ACTN|nr:NADPH:quinone oxidoreductase family protein [Nakamurella panacisegetis]SDP17112.1 NADPH2:quinone reductase [Nakamurella panacisegetis]
MRAWLVPRLGEAEQVMAQGDGPIPEPASGQLRLRVQAVALNFPDALMVRGEYQERPALPFTPGVELCGVVDGPQDSAIPAGTRVMGVASMPHGALAEYCIVDRAAVSVVPAGLDDIHAAGFTIAYQTGWVALHRRAQLRAGETLVVHAAAGGVGSAAVQLGKAAGARVVAVVGSASGTAGRGSAPEKVEVARRCGADVVIDRSTLDADGLIDALRSACGRGGADVIYDPVGGDAFTASTKVVAFEGRILVVGFASGNIPKAAVNHALVKNYGILGVYWGLYHQRRPEVVAQATQALSQLVAQGQVSPEVSSVLPFEQAPAGLAALAAGRSTGRIVVRGPERGGDPR